MRCAATSDRDGLLGLIESEGGIGVYRIEEWPDHSLRLLELVEISTVPEGFYPTSLLSRGDGGVLVSGSKTVSVGDMSICPGLDDVFAGDIEALQRMSAWELTSYEQRTPRLRVVPSLFGLNGVEEALPVTGQTSYTEVVDAVEDSGGTLTLLIAGGGDSLEAGYANRVELWSAPRGRWNTELVADGLGHSGPHFVAAAGDGTITALVHRQDGSVESWQRGPGRRRLDTTDERAALTTRSDGRLAVVAHVAATSP